MIQSLKRSLINQWCSAYRSMFLRRTMFIGVTGSCGKTTTKELIAAVLSTRYRGNRTPSNCNELWHIARIILRTRPRHEFCVLEIGAPGPGTLKLPLSLIRPRIGVVTTIGMDHFSQYGGMDAIALEKSKLVSCLPRNGIAVLNADDSRVLAMQSKSPGRVVTYGLSPSADLRAEDVSSNWPNRLSFTVRCENQSVRVETQLCGEHLVSNLLAAIAVGSVMGVSLEESAAAIREVRPIESRMFPVSVRDGVTLILDDVKAPVWTIPASLDFMRRASAQRKIMVFGTLSDYQEPANATYRRVAQQAREVSDFVFFVGRWSSRCLRARRDANDQSVQAFVTVDHLAKFLHEFLQPGDLVLVKGSPFADQLGQLGSKLERRPFEGRDLATSDRPASIADVTHPGTAMSRSERADQDYVTQVIVGLGNPGKKFQNTRHNVGQMALDHLAETLSGRWTQEEWGMVARAKFGKVSLLLVKPSSYMNESGHFLAKLAKQLGFSADSFILVQDDINLPPGVVRNRMWGSAGGHKGVQSIIAEFETEVFRRVKIGVGKPATGESIVDYVLTPIGAAQQAAIDAACSEAAQRVLQLVELRAREKSRPSEEAVL